jgi:regulatory protein
VPDDVAREVLDRFEQVGLVDDAEFARMWVESRHAGRGLSRRALRHELTARGVERDLVQDAVAEVDDDTEFAAACGLLRRRLASMTGPTGGAGQVEQNQQALLRRDRRLLGVLARKGYGSAIAYRALRRVLEEAGDEPSDEGQLRQ